MLMISNRKRLPELSTAIRPWTVTRLGRGPQTYFVALLCGLLIWRLCFDCGGLALKLCRFIVRPFALEVVL